MNHILILSFHVKFLLTQKIVYEKKKTHYKRYIYQNNTQLKLSINFNFLLNVTFPKSDYI